MSDRLLPWRTNRAAPSRSSSVAIRLLTALAVTASSSAVRSKVPSRAATSKARSPSIDGSRRSDGGGGAGGWGGSAADGMAWIVDA